MNDWAYNIFTIDYICIDSRLEVRKKKRKNPIYFSRLYLSKHIIPCFILLVVLARRKKRDWNVKCENAVILFSFSVCRLLPPLTSEGYNTAVEKREVTRE